MTTLTITIPDEQVDSLSQLLTSNGYPQPAIEDADIPQWHKDELDISLASHTPGQGRPWEEVKKKYADRGL